MSKSNRVFKYCTKFDKLVKVAVSPTPIPTPKAPIRPTSRFQRFVEYVRPTATNPFKSVHVGEGPHFGSLFAELKRVSTIKNPDFANFKEPKMLKELGLKIDDNPGSRSKGQIIGIDVEILRNKFPTLFEGDGSGSMKPEFEAALSKEISQFNAYKRQSAKQSKEWGGDAEGTGYRAGLRSKLPRRALVQQSTERAILGAKILGGLALLYFAFSKLRPSSKDKNKKSIIDNAIENEDLAGVPDSNSTITQIQSLNASLNKLSSLNPVLESNLEPYIFDGEEVVSTLEDLASANFDADNTLSLSSYAEEVSMAKESFNDYIVSLRNLSRTMARANKQNIVNKINMVINSLTQYINLISSYKTQ